jgi:hypothetical protein
MFTAKARAMASSTDPFGAVTIRRNRGPKAIPIDVDHGGMYPSGIGASTFAGE